MDNLLVAVSQTIFFSGAWRRTSNKPLTSLSIPLTKKGQSDVTDEAVFQISGADAGVSTDAPHQPRTVAQQGNDAELPSGPRTRHRGSRQGGQPSPRRALREELQPAITEQCHHSTEVVLEGSVATFTGTDREVFFPPPPNNWKRWLQIWLQAQEVLSKVQARNGTEIWVSGLGLEPSFGPKTCLRNPGPSASA